MCQHKDQGGTGFKDLTMFNEVMLAKLAWRLLHDDNSLFYRVFKARFFPKSSILEAKDSSSASYAWKNILKGREVLTKRALWRVEDGKKIRIWGDNWLPSKVSAEITTPVLFGQENSNVEVLINLVTRRWRTEVIDHVFTIQEAETIKNIPLSSTHQTDVLIWPFTLSGNYFVKSGYQFLQENSNVEVLINLVTRRWRTEVIDHVFTIQEAETIKNIPLSSTHQTDVLIWPFTLSSNYFVKSGYRFLHESVAQPQIAEQDSGF